MSLFITPCIVSTLVSGHTVPWSSHGISYWWVRTHQHVWRLLNPLEIHISLGLTQATDEPSALHIMNLVLWKYLFSLLCDFIHFFLLSLAVPWVPIPLAPHIFFLVLSLWVKYICLCELDLKHSPHDDFFFHCCCFLEISAEV